MDTIDQSTLLSIIGGALAASITLAGFIFSEYQTRKSTEEIGIAVKQVADAKPADIQQIAASQLELNNAYYTGVLQQSRLSFIVAIILAAAGLGIFFFIAQRPENTAIIGITGGTLTELLSAINFYLYGRASIQLDTFHSRLDKLQFFVLANSICENLNEELKYETRAKLVLAVTNLLTPNTSTTNSRSDEPKSKTKQTNNKKIQENEDNSE